MVLLGHDMMNHGWMSGQKLAGCIAVLSIRESMILPPHAITCISSIICTFWPHGPAMSLAGHVPKMHPPCTLQCNTSVFTEKGNADFYMDFLNGMSESSISGSSL